MTYNEWQVPFDLEKYSSYLSDDYVAPVDANSLIEEVQEVDSLITSSTPSVVPSQLLDFYADQGFDTTNHRPIIEDMKLLLDQVEGFQSMKNIITQTVFEKSLEDRVYRSETLFFREAKMNPIDLIVVEEDQYVLETNHDSIVVKKTESLCEIRSKSVLLPRLLTNVFTAGPTLDTILSVRANKVLGRKNIMDLHEGEDFLCYLLAKVRMDNEDDFYAINDSRGLLSRLEIYYHYLTEGYRRVLADNPRIKCIALMSPTPVDMRHFKRLGLWLDSKRPGFPKVIVIELNEHLSPSPEVLIVRSGYQHHLGKKYYMRDADDVTEDIYQTFPAVFGPLIEPHIGVSVICMPYDRTPVLYGYKFMYGKKSDRWVPYSQYSHGLNIGIYYHLPHRMRNFCVIKKGEVFEEACWSLVNSVATPRPLSALIMRIDFSLRRNMKGLAANSQTKMIHAKILNDLREKYDGFIQPRLKVRFRFDFEKSLRVVCIDPDKKFSMKSTSVISTSVLLRFCKAAPVGKASAVPAYKIGCNTGDISKKEVAEYAARKGMLRELVGTYVKYYTPERETIDRLPELPTTRNPILLTDGYAVSGNLGASNIKVVDNVTSTFYASLLGLKTHSSVKPPKITNRSTPENSRKQRSARKQHMNRKFRKSTKSTTRVKKRSKPSSRDGGKRWQVKQ